MNANVKIVNRTLLACASLWLACVLVASTAYADGQVRSEIVKFADLNVGTPAGAEALYGRIHAAARRVCEQPTRDWVDFRACVTKAESQAIGTLSLPMLTAYYEKKTGNHPQVFTVNR